MNNNLHDTWAYLIEWVSRMSRAHGGTVHDINGKSWDWGQALCRDLYGEDWMKEAEFNAICEIDPHDPAPDYVVDRAREWEHGDMPAWVVA